MLSEIESIPSQAKYFLDNSNPHHLPLRVPYIGMGSSYFASLAFKYMGIEIYPDVASEFFDYMYPGKKLSDGVLISQSGRSSEVLWCTSRFEKYTAISNDPGSPLCTSPAVAKVIPILAGEEKFSSSKTYVNTLLTLFTGFGIDVRKSVQLLAEKFEAYDEVGRLLADRVFERLQLGKVSGIYITGSGPNVATAMEAGLIMSEMTKLNFHGLAMALYDHGPKETAKDSIVLQIISKGKSYDRSLKLAGMIRDAGAMVLTVEEPGASEDQSVLHNIVPFNFMGYYLSKKLNVMETFVVGGKVTEVQ